jgi:hypothetical protein
MQATQGQSGETTWYCACFPSLGRHDIIFETVNQTPQELAWEAAVVASRSVYLYLYHMVHPVDVRSNRPVLTGGVLVRRHGRLTF